VTAPRYAIYYAPAVDSAWWRFGAGWLGWDAQRGAAVPQATPPEFSEAQFHALTTEPRRYGFHATLKAPFRLGPRVSERLLHERVQALARRLAPVSIGAVEPVMLADFVALVPVQRRPAVDSLAARCVMELDDLRAPLTEAELARRNPAQLDAAERDMLQRYGYPYVLGLFRLHFTLSGRVDPVTAGLLVHRARQLAAPLNETAPLQLDRLCIFRENHPGAPFLRIHEEVFA
jgi:putative phosphonate metabolism protein